MNFPSRSRLTPLGNCRISNWLILFAIVCFASTTPQAIAQTTYVWNPGSNTWELQSSWSPGGGPPGAGDIAEFSSGTSGTDLIKWDGKTGNQRVGQLHFTKGNYTFDNLETNPFQLLIESSAVDAFRVLGAGQTITNNGLQIVVGSSNAVVGQGATFNIGTGSGGMSGGLSVNGSLDVDGNMNVDGGLVSNQSGTIGVGTVTLSGGAQWRNTKDLYVGKFGAGTLEVGSGAKVSSNNGYVAGFISNPLTSGTATITGQGSMWNVTGVLSVGAGDGTLNILNEGLVTSRSGSIGGYIPNGHAGRANVSGEGTLWSLTDEMIIGTGISFAGFLNVSDKANVTNKDAFIGYGHSSSQGTVVVDGDGSHWNSTETLTVGRMGTGILTIDNGGLVSSNRGLLGYHESSSTGNGTVTSRGANSRWDVAEYLNVGQTGNGNLTAEDQGAIHVGTDLNLGGDSNAAGGTGTLTLDSGGMVNVTGTTRLWSGGTIDFVSGGTTGGTLTTNSFDNSTGGTLNFHNGTLNLSGAGGSFEPGSSNFRVDGLVATDLPTFKVSNNADIVIGDSLEVGKNNAGGLLVESNATLTTNSATLGYEDGSSGAATVSDGSQWINSNTLVVGRNGQGTLTIENGGQVVSNGGNISFAGSASGSVTISGEGSQWSVTDRLFVGFGGTSTLDVLDKGRVTSHRGYIGLSSSNSTATISGEDSQWTLSDFIIVGGSGNGTLSIADKGVVSNVDAFLATGSGGTGTVTVDGDGSQWNNSGIVSVGSIGNGTLTITNGGLVTSHRGALGFRENFATGGNGTVTSRGTGSLWDVTNYLNVGQNGSGNLTAEDQGAINVGTDLNLGGSSSESGGTGTLTLNSGGMVNVVGTTRLWSGGTLELDGGSLTTSSFDNSEGGGFNFRKGTLTVDGSEGIFDPGTSLLVVSGASANETANLRLINGLTTNFTDATIGGDGAGTLLLSNGASLTNEIGAIGLVEQGLATIESNSTWTNTSSLTVGASGNLDIKSGGVVTSYTGSVNTSTSPLSDSVTIDGQGSNWQVQLTLSVGDASSSNSRLTVQNEGVVTSGDGMIGSSSSAVGSVSVIGANSRWDNTNDLKIGFQGTGTLNVESGGKVGVGGTTYLGERTGTNPSDGTLNVTGEDSKFVTNVDLLVGHNGIGTMTIDNMGAVENQSGRIGNLVNGQGTVTVTGEGSRWNNSEFLYVGREGQGTLEVLDKGLVTSQTSYISTLSGSSGTVLVSGEGSSWDNSGYLYSSGTFDIESGGHVLSGNARVAGGITTIDGRGSILDVDNTLEVGGPDSAILDIRSEGVANSSQGQVGFGSSDAGTVKIAGAKSEWVMSDRLFAGFLGNSNIEVLAGANVRSNGGDLAALPPSVSDFTVSGPGSAWINSGNLNIGGRQGGLDGGNATLTIGDEGLVSVATTTSIFSGGSVDLQGGRFEFGQTTLQDFSRIGGTSGTLAGQIDNVMVTDIASLTPFQNNAFEMSEVIFTNSNVLFGSAANLGVSVNNLVDGELFAGTGTFVHFKGTLENYGEVNNVGGTIRFDDQIINQADGFISGRGSFIADAGFRNFGTIAVSGDSDFFGDMDLLLDGNLITSGLSTTTFHDDVVHNGTEIRTSQGSSSVFFGEFTGDGAFVGDGTVFFEGDLRPGNSPGILAFGGDVVLGETAWTEIEIGGTELGLFDQLSIDGDFWASGQLSVSFINGFELDYGNEFLIADVDGIRTGEFLGLTEGDLVGHYGGVALFISYQGGSGNDIRLFSAVPEPASGSLALLTFVGLACRRRRYRKLN